MCKSMFSLFCLDNLFLPFEKPVQEQRDTLEPKHLLISFVFAVAVFPRTAQQALKAVFGSACYPTRFIADTGRVCVQVRYGTRVLELAKGKNSIEVANGDELLSVLETVKRCVEAGELDAQIDAASNAVRARFVK